MAIVYQFQRRQDVRLSPRRLGRKPKAPVVELDSKRSLKGPIDAYNLYLQASAIDEQEPERALAMYERAVKLDPSLAIAWTNLGNLHFKAHRPERAEWHYEHALELDPRQPEATYNLGYIRLERGQVSEAISLLDRAIQLDPDFADAHFNLAMAFEQYDSPKAAQRHWRAYLKLEPSGTWSDIARRHLLDEPTETQSETPKLRLVQ